MAEGVVALLIAKLGFALAKEAVTFGASLLCKEVSALKGLFGEIRKAKEELETMQAYLQGAERFKDTDETTAGIFINKIRGFSFEIEDVVDEFTYKLEDRHGDSWRICCGDEEEGQAHQGMAPFDTKASRYQCQDSGNKIKILDAGALEPLLGYLQSSDLNLQEYAAAAILTLSASSTNKPIISASGAIPLLVKVLEEGNPQAKNDAVMALYNLSTIADNLQTILSVQPIPPLLELLRCGKRSSKTADKCCALLESLLAFDQGRVALTSEEGGVLTIVEVLEEGSLQGREHAVGALLTMCESDRSKYRDPILNEGAIPGLLELTAHGTPKSRVKAHALLDLLRNSPYSRSKLQPNTLENIVSNIASQIDGEDRGGKAKKMLAEMVKVSMEQSLRHLQRRASFA